MRTFYYAFASLVFLITSVGFVMPKLFAWESEWSLVVIAAYIPFMVATLIFIFKEYLNEE